MLETIVILAAGAYIGKHVKVSVSEDAQRIANRLLQTGLAQLPSATATVKGWATKAIASAQHKALPPVQEISDEVLKEIEEVHFMSKESVKAGAEILAGLSDLDRADEMDATRDDRVSSALKEARQQKAARTVLGSK